MSISDKIDIVILNCNNDGYIQKCIDTIKKNTIGYNLIIVDQNSQDGTREWLIESSVASNLILNKRNLGTAVGRNQGIRVGRNPWIALIDSDIEIRDKEWLDKVWNYTIDNRIGLIECGVETKGNGRRFAGLSFCMIRRKCIEEIGLFDSHFYINEQLDWWVRLEWSKWKTAYCYDTDILHHGSKTIEGCLKNKLPGLIDESNKLLQLKYTKAFLDQTLMVNWERRNVKKEELL